MLPPSFEPLPAIVLLPRLWPLFLSRFFFLQKRPVPSAFDLFNKHVHGGMTHLTLTMMNWKLVKRLLFGKTPWTHGYVLSVCIICVSMYAYVLFTHGGHSYFYVYRMKTLICCSFWRVAKIWILYSVQLGKKGEMIFFLCVWRRIFFSFFLSSELFSIEASQILSSSFHGFLSALLSRSRKAP